MSSAYVCEGRGQASDVIVEPALVQPSIRANRLPMEGQDSASFSSRACHVTLYTDFVRGYATFDTLLNYKLLLLLISIALHHTGT